MMSTEVQTHNSPQASTIYDERIFNERLRQLFHSTDSNTLSTLNGTANQMTSIVDVLFPEQTYLNQQSLDRHYDLTKTINRHSLSDANIHNKSNKIKINNSILSFCGETTDETLKFVNRPPNKAYNSSTILPNNYHHQTFQTSYRSPPPTRPRFTSSSVRIATATTVTVPASNCNSKVQRSSSTLSSNSTCPTLDYQPRFASRISTIRLPSVRFHGRIGTSTNKIDSIALSSLGAIDRSSPAFAVYSRF